MKAILLMRHAKSDWGSGDLEDRDRPLAPRGREDAPRMGWVLKRLDRVPDRIVSSDAVRARQTAELVAEASSYGHAIVWEPALYAAAGAAWLDAIGKLPAKVDCVLVVAHSPGIEQAAALLVAGLAGRRKQPAALGIHVPTAGLLCIEAEVPDWAGLEPGRGVLQWFLTPRMVKDLS